MSKDAFIRARTDAKLKSQVEAIFERLGLNTSEAITLFFNQVVCYDGLPFAVRIPNAETIAAMREPVEGLQSFETVEALFEHWDKALNEDD